MKFRRIELIRRIDVEIEHREKAALRDLDERQEDYVDAEAKWIANYRGNWLAFARKIVEVSETGPIRQEHVPVEILRGGYRDALEFFTQKPPEFKPARVGDLLTLKRMLESVVDDEVSTADLVRLGFKIPALFGG